MTHIELAILVRGFEDEMLKLAEAKKPLISGEDVSGLSGAAVGGGSAQHFLPDVGKSGMTKFRRGALVAAMIGGGNLAGRAAHRVASTALQKKAAALAIEKNAGFMDSLRGIFGAAPAVSPRAMSSLAGARPARLAPRVGYQAPTPTRAQQLQADYMKRTGKTPLQAVQEQMSSTRGTDPSVYSDMTGLNPALARRLGAKTF